MTSFFFLLIWLAVQGISTLIILKAIKKVANPKQETETYIDAFVTPTNPAFVREEIAGHGDSVIVTPKSPQLIEWEENEQLRKLNLKPQ